MRIYDKTQTFPMPRRRKTVIIPARRLAPANGFDYEPRPRAGDVEAPKDNQLAADTAAGKHAPAGPGTALAAMSTGAPKKTPRKMLAPSSYGATLALVCERWPAIFGAARPLKIGIHRDIEAALAQQISKTALRKFLARWTHREPYRQALAAGVRRVDLAGHDAGPAWQPPGEDTGIRSASRGVPLDISDTAAAMRQQSVPKDDNYA